ncbi:hypothetical protein L9F63_011812 [Diploptera punctata]|uniref:Uncharacterized protein n=1 Tax=Diploptera punctata TaxID=6984 RepID=A0AAD8EP71_DIPPU|nr:hypothetical protein L9F63_011812 [Diploptera punctata]
MAVLKNAEDEIERKSSESIKIGFETKDTIFQTTKIVNKMQDVEEEVEETLFLSKEQINQLDQAEDSYQNLPYVTQSTQQEKNVKDLVVDMEADITKEDIMLRLRREVLLSLISPNLNKILIKFYTTRKKCQGLSGRYGSGHYQRRYNEKCILDFKMLMLFVIEVKADTGKKISSETLPFPDQDCINNSQTEKPPVLNSEITQEIEHNEKQNTYISRDFETMSEILEFYTNQGTDVIRMKENRQTFKENIPLTRYEISKEEIIKCQKANENGYVMKNENLKPELENQEIQLETNFKELVEDIPLTGYEISNEEIIKIQETNEDESLGSLEIENQEIQLETNFKEIVEDIPLTGYEISNEEIIKSQETNEDESLGSVMKNENLKPEVRN